MAGGGTSWQDVALYLIARFVDVETAVRSRASSLIDFGTRSASGRSARIARSRQVSDAAVALPDVDRRAITNRRR
jgi:hypothetical protein